MNKPKKKALAKHRKNAKKVKAKISASLKNKKS